MCTYPLLQYKHKHKFSLPQFLVIHFYIPSTTAQTETQWFISKMISLFCVHNLYYNKNPNTKDHCQCLGYACLYNLKTKTLKHKGSLTKCPVLHAYIPSTILKT